MKNVNMLFAFLSGAGIQEICLAGGNASKETQVHDEKHYVSVAPLASSRSAMSSSSYSAASSSSYALHTSEVTFANERKHNSDHQEGYLPAARPTSGLLKLDDARGAKITLSAQELEVLRQAFDNSLETPDGSGRYLRFDYKHIFNASNKARKHVGHYDPKGEFSKAQKKVSRGVFPKGWTPYEIMAIIKQAYAQRSSSNNGQRERQNWVMTVVDTSYGFKIRLVFALDKNGKCTGKVKTAYPVQ